MTEYKIEVHYQDKYVEKLTKNSLGSFEWETKPKTQLVEALSDELQILNSLCNWLARNGGVKVEVTESTP